MQLFDWIMPLIKSLVNFFPLLIGFRLLHRFFAIILLASYAGNCLMSPYLRAPFVLFLMKPNYKRGSFFQEFYGHFDNFFHCSSVTYNLTQYKLRVDPSYRLKNGTSATILDLNSRSESLN